MDIMKKVYTVNLDEEAVAFVKPFLEKKGLSFSGFLNQAVVEYAAALKDLNIPDDVGMMTIKDFMAMFSRMVKGLKE